MMQVKPITRAEAKDLILNVHYARRMPSVSYAYGLFDDEDLVGVVTYGQPASPFLCIGVAGRDNKQRVIELNRLVMRPGYEGDNHGSMLVGRSLRLLPPGKIVVSYADQGGWGHVGYVYQASNFLYTGMTKRRTDMYSETGHSRHNCGDSTRRQLRTEKHRYVYVTGNKGVRRRLEAQIKYPIQPYPKGGSRRYDTNNPTGLVKAGELT